MRTAFIFLLSFTLITGGPKERIVLDPGELVKIPFGLKGDFIVAAKAPSVEAYLFTGLPQDEKSTLWTSWGNGCFASNGKYYTAIGDHRGYNGNSFVYEYDPASGTLKKIVDVAAAIRQKNGEYGHGKIHAAIHDYQGALYFATYRGKANQVEEAIKKGYRGSLLFRYDWKRGKLENLGAIAPGENLPVSALDSARGLLYFNTVPKGDLLAYDLKKRVVKFQGGSNYLGGYRSIILTREGLVYFSDEKGKLSFYNPDKNAITQTEMILPGEKNTLRAATTPASDGRVFGMTQAGRMFELQPNQQKVKDLGPNFLSGDYTAIMLLSKDNKYIYFAPGAHGSAAKVGTPVIQYEIRSGKRKVIAFLKDPLMTKAGYYVGGNYNLQLDNKDATLYATFNGSLFQKGEKKQKAFGLPSLVVIKIPDSER